MISRYHTSIKVGTSLLATDIMKNFLDSKYLHKNCDSKARTSHIVYILSITHYTLQLQFFAFLAVLVLRIIDFSIFFVDFSSVIIGSCDGGLKLCHQV